MCKYWIGFVFFLCYHVFTFFIIQFIIDTIILSMMTSLLFMNSDWSLSSIINIISFFLISIILFWITMKSYLFGKCCITLFNCLTIWFTPSKSSWLFTFKCRNRICHLVLWQISWFFVIIVCCIWVNRLKIVTLWVLSQSWI